MIERLRKMLFGEEPRLVVVQTDERTEAMRREERKLQRELGFELHDGAQNWLRLHQLLKSHEDRIAALEAKQ